MASVGNAEGHVRHSAVQVFSLAATAPIECDKPARFACRRRHRSGGGGNLWIWSVDVRPGSAENGMRAIRGLLITATVCFFVGLIGTSYIWLRSSSVATDQYTHHYNMHFKGGTQPYYFYLSDEQDSSYKMLNTLLEVGLWSLIGLAVVMRLMQVANKNG
jgi:hypothetical protein